MKNLKYLNLSLAHTLTQGGGVPVQLLNGNFSWNEILTVDTYTSKGLSEFFVFITFCLVYTVARTSFENKRFSFQISLHFF